MRIACIAIALSLIAAPAFAQLKTYVQYDPITGAITGTVKSHEGEPAPNHGFFKQTELDGWVETEGYKINILTRGLQVREKKLVEIDVEGVKETIEVYRDDPEYTDFPEIEP